MGVTCGNDDIDLRADELGSVLRELIDAKAVAVRIVDEVLRFDEALLTQDGQRRNVPRRTAPTELQAAEAIGAACFLRARRAGQQSCGTEHAIP